MTTGITQVILLSDSLMDVSLGTGFALQTIAPWLLAPTPVWQGKMPLAVMLNEKDAQALIGQPFEQLLQSQSVPVFQVSSEESARNAVLQALQARLLASEKAQHAGRLELAEIRKDYMQLQENFSAVEGYLLHNFAPQFTCARDWQPAEDALLHAGTYRQRLPIGSTALAAVDIWAAGAGTGRLRFVRNAGAAFAPEIELVADAAGWVRADLPQPLTGPAEDIWIEVESDFALALSQPSALASMRVSGGAAPLALRAWRGLPEVRLPPMEPAKKRFVLPASAMPEPEVLGGGAVKRLSEREAFALHPGHDGHLDVVFRGVTVPMAANLAAYAQNFGPETVTLSLGLVDGPAPRQAYLSGESHGQFDLDLPESEAVDLIIRLRAPSGMASVFIRGIEFFPLEG